MNKISLPTQPYHLICGTICGSIPQITPLLKDINKLTHYYFLQQITLYLLANSVTEEQLKNCVAKNCSQITSVNILTHQNKQMLSIGKARCLLQKAIGQTMVKDNQGTENIFTWLIDDDMRIPAIAENYLQYLPLMKQRGIDAVIGCIDGSPPNPPAHGMRVQINDLYHNLTWLETLQPDMILPDKSSENEEFRKRYPDYYYDLSRKHSAHLTLPYWLESTHHTWTVAEARQYIFNNLDKIFTGEPFLRPLINRLPENPLNAMRPSCNRGGNCFILNAQTLTLTPNAITQTNGTENRRSDMVWALINRYYHGFNMVQVDFPLYHHRFTNNKNTYDLEKHIAEMIGSSIYASLDDFLQRHPKHHWNFTQSEINEILQLYRAYNERRLKQYISNQQANNDLLHQLEHRFAQKYPTLKNFIAQARQFTNVNNFKTLSDSCKQQDRIISQFLLSLPAIINDYSKICRADTAS